MGKAQEIGEEEDCWGSSARSRYAHKSALKAVIERVTRDAVFHEPMQAQDPEGDPENRTTQAEAIQGMKAAVLFG